MTPALKARGLTKRYGEVVAVDALDFEVQPGEIVGVLGPNGAGKTTALQLCLKLLDADAGEALVFGKDPEDLAVRRRIGYAPDAPLFPRALTGASVLALHAELAGVPKERIAAIVSELRLEDIAGRPCATYSKGQSQRLGLAQALLAGPELLFLDEPTAGLDPAGVASMREMLLRQKARGCAVVLNSHLLSEVERVCDRVLFVKRGRLLHVHEMKSAGRRVDIRLRHAAPAAFAALGTLDGDRLRIPVPDESAVPPLVRRLVESGADIVEVKPGGEPLEELYLNLVEGEGRA